MAAGSSASSPNGRQVSPNARTETETATATGGSSHSYPLGREDLHRGERRQSPAALAHSADTGPAAASSSGLSSSAAFPIPEPPHANETNPSDRTELEARLASLDISHAHLSTQLRQLTAERDSLVEHVRSLEGQLAETADPREVEGLRVRIEEQEAEMEGLKDQVEEGRERILNLVGFLSEAPFSFVPILERGSIADSVRGDVGTRSRTRAGCPSRGQCPARRQGDRSRVARIPA